jgi:hypothetical protein
MVLEKSGRYPWSFVTHIFHNDQPSHGGDRKGTLGSVASLLAANLNQGNPDRNRKLWNIVSSEYMPEIFQNFCFTFNMKYVNRNILS